jgi:hypothetical protein
MLHDRTTWISVKGGLEKWVLLCSSAVPLLYIRDCRFAHGTLHYYLSWTYSRISSRDICLARMGKLIRTGNNSIDSVEIELLEYSPLIALDLSVYYPVRVSLWTPLGLWPSTAYLLCHCTHILVVCFVEGSAVCMVEQRQNSAAHLTFLRIQSPGKLLTWPREVNL